MKEASNRFEGIFNKGLRPFHKRTVPFQIYNLFNFRPTQSGIMPYSPVVIPISEDVIETNNLDDEVFPFPQLIVGKKHTFIGCSEKIYVVDPEDWDTITQLTTYGTGNPTVAKDITAGGIWELADFWDSWFLTNGVCTVFGCGKDWIEAHIAQRVYVSDDTAIQAAVDYKGRVLFGGFDVHNFWSSTAKTFLTAWYKKNYDTLFDPSLTTEGELELAPVYENFIWGSSIGGGDALLFFFPDKVLTTGLNTSSFGTDNPFYLEIMQRNEQIFAPMPMQGQVLNFRKLGEGLCVFSADGVSHIKAVPSPSPTFNIQSLPKAGGIANRGAVASSESEIVYVDNSGTLVKITAGGEVVRLGYKEYIYDLLEAGIVISYSPDPYEGGYFISDGEQTFVLSDNGLFEVGHIVTSVFYKDGATVGMGTALSGTANIVGEVGIDANDFGLSGVKTLEWVRVEVDETSVEDDPIPSLQVSIDYLYTNVGDGTWGSIGYRNVNKEGVVYFPVTGTKFRINIKVSNYANHSIIYAEVGIKQGDRRYTRHFSVGEANNRAGA